MRNFYVCILSSKSRVLYTGITDNIYRRTWERKNDVNPGFGGVLNLASVRLGDGLQFALDCV